MAGKCIPKILSLRANIRRSYRRPLVSFDSIDGSDWRSPKACRVPKVCPRCRSVYQVGAWSSSNAQTSTKTSVGSRRAAKIRWRCLSEYQGGAYSSSSTLNSAKTSVGCTCEVSGQPSDALGSTRRACCSTPLLNFERFIELIGAFPLLVRCKEDVIHRAKEGTDVNGFGLDRSEVGSARM